MPTNAGTARASAPVFHPTDYLRFLVPSTIGVGMMLVPIRFGDTINIGLGILADELRARAAGLLPGLVTSVIVLSAAATIAMTVFRSRLSA